MPGPARTGVLVYAKNVDTVSLFYQKVLGAVLLHADHGHRVLQSPDVQLIIQVLPEQHTDSVAIETPPVPRLEQAIKPFFTVKSLADSGVAAAGCSNPAADRRKNSL